MKKNRIFILGIVTMFVAILSLTLVSGTLARYTSSGKGSDSVQVAKWDVRIDTESLTSVTPSSHTFELFKVGANYDEDYNDVAAERIAPGTSGVFSFTLQNKSEVTARYAIDYTVDEKQVPLKWSVDGINWTDELADVDASAETNLNILTGEKVISVQWKWEFTGDDVKDTSLGVTPVSPEVTIQVTFTQVD